MGKTIMGGAAVSLDGFIADDNDEVGPLFDWLGSGDVSWRLPGSQDEARGTQASADFMTSQYGNTAANVIGRRLFDLTNGWSGQPAAYEHVFVVTHQPPTYWEHAATAPFTFMDGVEQAIAAAGEFAGRGTSAHVVHCRSRCAERRASPTQLRGDPSMCAAENKAIVMSRTGFRGDLVYPWFGGVVDGDAVPQGEIDAHRDGRIVAKGGSGAGHQAGAVG